MFWYTQINIQPPAILYHSTFICYSYFSTKKSQVFIYNYNDIFFKNVSMQIILRALQCVSQQRSLKSHSHLKRFLSPKNCGNCYFFIMALNHFLVQKIPNIQKQRGQQTKPHTPSTHELQQLSTHGHSCLTSTPNRSSPLPPHLLPPP